VIAHQADNQIEEEHLLNFVVNSLNEDLPIDLTDGVRVSTENSTRSSLAPAPADLDQSHLRDDRRLSHANTVRGHLTDQFDLDTVEQVGDTLLQQETIDALPDRPVEVVADLHLDPTTAMKTRQ